MSITFAPQITVQGGGNVQADVQKALQLSYVDFERLMRQYLNRTARRSYGEPS